MASQSRHLNLPLPVTVEFSVGLHERLEASGSFVVLADRYAVHNLARQRWLKRWGSHCLLWVWQDRMVSSLGVAENLAQQIWPALGSDRNNKLWAIGGGTTLDLGKMLRWRMPDVSMAGQAWRNNRIPSGSVRHRLWCSPATAGSGSEVTPWATVWDSQSSSAFRWLWHPMAGYPERAIVDPCLTLSCPPSVTRDCGLDALSRALESIWSQQTSLTSRALACEAARLILGHLPALMRVPSDLYLRERLAYGSLLAGLAMAQTRTALAHALSYDLTSRESTPHGLACATWLPMVMSLALERSARVRQDLQTVFGQPAAEAPNTVQVWLSGLGVSCRDLRQTHAGNLTLAKAMSSDPGRNFIAPDR
jgi:alcohol dehydrogenase class IV